MFMGFYPVRFSYLMACFPVIQHSLEVFLFYVVSQQSRYVFSISVAGEFILPLIMIFLYYFLFYFSEFFCFYFVAQILFLLTFLQVFHFFNISLHSCFDLVIKCSNFWSASAIFHKLLLTLTSVFFLELIISLRFMSCVIRRFPDQSLVLLIDAIGRL